MSSAESGSDEEFAEWYVWAKREVSTDNRVCQGAAQAAVQVLAEGGDRVAATRAARRSQAGQSVVLAGQVAPLRRSYAEWYDWVRRESAGNSALLHRATRSAIQRLRAGGSSEEAAGAARSLLEAAVMPGQSSPGPPQPAPGLTPVEPSTQPSPAEPLPDGPPQRALMNTTPPAPPQPRYAGFWLRSLGLLIDALVVLLGCVIIAFFILVLVFVAVVSTSGHAPADNPTVWLGPVVILLVLTWLYFAGLESSAWQATLGKRATRLQVTDRMGRRLTFGRATGRFFARAISAIPLLIGFLVAAFTPRKQALHDLIAGTVVVKRSRPQASGLHVPHAETQDRASLGSEVPLA